MEEGLKDWEKDYDRDKDEEEDENKDKGKGRDKDSGRDPFYSGRGKGGYHPRYLKIFLGNRGGRDKRRGPIGFGDYDYGKRRERRASLPVANWRTL